MNLHVLAPHPFRRIPILARRRPAPGLFGDLDRFFDAFWSVGAPERGAFAPVVDYSEDEKEIRVSAELPGLEEQDIRVSLDEGVLTIEGERIDERSEADPGGFRHLESRRGSFRRALHLGADVDENATQALYRNGVLTVTLPKLASEAPRTIPVTTS